MNSEMSDNTTIGISRETWKALNSRKEVGDSFEDVLRRILGLEEEEGKSEPKNDEEKQ